MATATEKSVRPLGFWSAVLCTVFSLAYVVAQLGEWAGVLGSAGGPHSRSTAFGLMVLLTPSLLLGISFAVLQIGRSASVPRGFHCHTRLTTCGSLK